MDLCGGCFAIHGVRTSVAMKASHFARRRFSLQPVTLSRESSDESPSAPPPPSSTAGSSATRPRPQDRRHASGSAACGGDSDDRRKKKYRVVMMGAARVGKTAIINQFLYDTFTTKYTRTIEEMHHGEYEVSSMCLTLEILDTSGALEFPAMRELSVRSADAFILVYAINDADSFEEVRTIREFILSLKRSPVPMVVVGNKTDLEEERAIPLETAETIVLLDWENGFIEASAKDNFHVLKIFKELLNQAKIRHINFQKGTEECNEKAERLNRYALSPAVKRRRQSMPNVGLHVTPAQLSHLNHLKLKNGGKRNSCSIQ